MPATFPDTAVGGGLNRSKTGVILSHPDRSLSAKRPDKPIGC